MLQVLDARMSISESGAAWQDGYIERLIRPIKGEEVDPSVCMDYNHVGSRFAPRASSFLG